MGNRFYDPKGLKYLQNMQVRPPRPDRQEDKGSNFWKVALLVLLVVVLAVLVGAHRHLGFLEPAKVIVIAPKDSVQVYLPGTPGKLKSGKVEIDVATSERERADIIITALKKDKCVPDGLLLRELATDNDGNIYLNFSKELASGNTDIRKEATMIYSIVNSFLATFRNSKKVQLLMEGVPVYTVNGAIYTFLPLEFNKDITED